MIEAAATGRLGNPPQRRETKNGNAMATFSLACGTGDEMCWLSVAAFEALAEELPTDLERGEQLYVEGKLRLNRWGDDGQRVNLQLTATRIIVLGRIGRRRRKPARKHNIDHQAPLDDAA